MLLIAAIEDVLVAAVQQIFGTKIRQCDTMPADFDVDALKRALGMMPFVGIAFGGGQDPQPGSAVASIDGLWTFVGITGHASGEKARRRGDALQVGAYEICELLARQVHGFKVVANLGTQEEPRLVKVGSMVFQSINNLFEGKLEGQGVAVYSVSFKLRTEFPAQADPSVLAPFTSFHGTFDVEPRPAPDGADRPPTEVVVELPQE